MNQSLFWNGWLITVFHSRYAGEFGYMASCDAVSETVCGTVLADDYESALIAVTKIL